MKDLFKEYCVLLNVKGMGASYLEVLDLAFTTKRQDEYELIVSRLKVPAYIKKDLVCFYEKLHAHENFIF